MATPLNADQFLAALKAEGLHIAEYAGWRTHNRAGHGGWGPMNGVMIHHTAGVAPGDENVVWAGRAGLPGPLAHGYLAKSGTVTMTANGRANHAGGGSPAVLAAVAAETYLATPPPTHFHDGSAGAVDGNAHFYGLEISNLGDHKDPYSDAQYEAAVKWAAALCRTHKWSSKSVIAHSEWSDWKSDPSFDIKLFRTYVAAALALQAGAWRLHPVVAPRPAKTPSKETAMPTPAEYAVAVWTSPLASPVAPEGSDPARPAGAYLRYGDVHHAAVMAELADLKAQLAALAATLSKA